MKKGITLINLTVVILLLALIAGMVVYEGSDAIATTNKTKFAIEILDVQTKVDNYYMENGKYPSVTQVTFDVSKLKEEEKAQIAGETVASNSITLYSIDLNLLGIKNTVYGNNKNSKDVYAVSEITGKVYYINGIKFNKVKYYTLTDELYSGMSTSILPKNYKEVRKEEVVFRVNRLEVGKEAVTIDVMVPSDATGITVTATNSITVASAVTEGEYKKYSVNASKVTRNYVVTVKYTLDSTAKTVTYTVNNVDVEGPGSSIYMVKYSGYTVIKIEPNHPEQVAKIKIDKGNLTKEYFSKYGKNVENNEYTCYTAGTYTVYLEDLLGNTTISLLNVTII